MNPAIPEIDTLFHSQAELWNRHDTRAYAALWIENCTFVNVAGMHREGRAALLAELDYLHADRFKKTQVEMQRLTLRFLTPALAIATVKWQMSGDPGIPGFATRDGRRQGIFTHVIQRTPEGWRFVASHNTDTLPIPDPLLPARPEFALV